MDNLESQVLDYVTRFPFNTVDFYEDRIVHHQRVMTASEFQASLKNLREKGEVYEPRPGYYEPTASLKDKDSAVERGKPQMREMIPVKKKAKVPKAHVRIMVRRDVEGYTCRNCGKWINRPWDKPRLRKCPKCGKKTYYGTPVLKKDYRHVEKRTNHWRKLFEPILGRRSGVINKERVGKAGMTAAALPMPKPKPEAVMVKPKSGYRGKHVKRDKKDPEYEKHASHAGHLAWQSRREKQVVGFFRDRKDRKVHPIVKDRRKQRQLIQRGQSKPFSVKPRKRNSSLSRKRKMHLAGIKAHKTRLRNLRKKKQSE